MLANEWFLFRAFPLHLSSDSSSGFGARGAGCTIGLPGTTVLTERLCVSRGAMLHFALAFLACLNWGSLSFSSRDHSYHRNTATFSQHACTKTTTIEWNKELDGLAISGASYLWYWLSLSKVSYLVTMGVCSDCGFDWHDDRAFSCELVWTDQYFRIKWSVGYKETSINEHRKGCMDLSII